MVGLGGNCLIELNLHLNFSIVQVSSTLEHSDAGKQFNKGQQGHLCKQLQLFSSKQNNVLLLLQLTSDFQNTEETVRAFPDVVKTYERTPPPGLFQTAPAHAICTSSEVHHTEAMPYISQQEQKQTVWKPRWPSASSFSGVLKHRTSTQELTLPYCVYLRFLWDKEMRKRRPLWWGLFLAFYFPVLRGHLFSRHHYLVLKNTFSSLRSQNDKASRDLHSFLNSFSADTRVKAGY